ncbi:MAG: nucleotidyltransferase domain-containing protein, partial [Vulcanisaeta sp.]
MEKVIKWREELRSRAIELARQVAGKVQGTVFLVGSYARGDFMEDSDIDVLIIAQFTEPPHR